MPKRKASFYGVRVGNQPGVYDDWELCKIQVLGFPGSQYKGFPTRAEAENYVKDCLTGSQNTAIANLDGKPKQCLLPIATSKKHAIQPCSQKVKTSKEEATSPSHPLTKVTTPKKEPFHPSTKDLSKSFKLIEENGQSFVVFESIKDFDSYFEDLCRSRHSRKSWTLENQEIRSQDQTPDCSQHLQTKVTVEDEEFVYFKDEDELKSFLEPYFEDAKQDPPDPNRIYQNFDAAPQASSFSRQGVYQIEYDGASKGNPGRAGAGALIRCPHGSVVMEMTEYLGIETNNVAEYRALILGLKGALSRGIQRVKAQGDSKLVSSQVTGAWKVENKNLIPLHKEVKGLENLFESFSISHVRRVSSWLSIDNGGKCSLSLLHIE
eukprot:c22554_g1_i8 orf=691-1824(-)